MEKNEEKKRPAADASLAGTASPLPPRRRETDYNLETLRLIACVFVVLIHVTNIYSRAYPGLETGSWMTALAVNTLSRISIPVFFLISGLLVTGSRIDVRKALRKTLKYAVVLTAWSVLYLLWDYLYMGYSYDFQNVFYEPVKRHLWYLYALIGLYLALPLIQTLFQNASVQVEKWFAIGWFLFLTADFILTWLGIRIGYEIPIIGNVYYLGYFCMGHLIGKYIDRIRLKNSLLIVFCCLALLCIFALTAGFSSLEQTHYTRMFQYRDPLYAIASLSFFVLIYRNRSRQYSDRAKRIITRISESSFGIYLIQILFLDLIRTNFPILSLHAAAGVPLFTMAVFLLSFAAVTVMRKIPLLRDIV